MAKPTVSLPPWATDENFSTGPFPGQPTKVTIPDAVAAEGHRPGKAYPTSAEHDNYWRYVLSSWIGYVEAASSAGADDQHLVESGTDGRFQIEGIDIVPANANAYALKIATPPGAGYGILAQGGTAFGDAVIHINANTGSSPGLQINGTGSSGFAALITGGASVAALRVTGPAGGILALSSGTSPALQVTGGATTTVAALFSSTNSSGRVVDVLGSDDAAEAMRIVGGENSNGLYSLGGTAGGAGVLGEARNTDAFGVHGRSDDAAVLAAGGVYGQGRNQGLGVLAESEDGYALRLRTLNNTRAPLIFSGQAGYPANTQIGTVAYNLTNDLIARSVNSTWCGLMWRRLGPACECKSATGTSTTDDPVEVITRSLTGYQAPKEVGKIVIRIDLGIGRTGTCQIGFQLIDETAADVVKDWTLPLYQSGAAVYERETTLSVEYELPATGSRTFRLDMFRVGGDPGDTVRCRDVVMTIDGVYEG